jgi:hypothetical protein
MSLNEKQFRRQKLDAQRVKSMQFHEDLRPMKETLKAQGVSYSAVSGHLKTNAHILFGGPMNKKDTLYWAIKKHAEDPENFLKNIGMK